MIDALESKLLSDWPTFELGGGLPSSLQFSRVGSLRERQREGALTFITHADWQAGPCMTVKVVKEPDFEALVELEHQRLEELQRQLGREYRDTIPRTLTLCRVEKMLVSARAFLDGRALPGYFKAGGGARHRRQVLRDTRAAVEWLRRFDEATAASGREVPAAGYVDEMRRRFESSWGLTDAARSLFQRMTAQLGERTLSLRPSHGDFCDRNLVGLERGVGVIDWSHFHPHSPPLSDLVNLLIARQSRGLSLERPGSLLPLHRLDRDHWFGRCVDEILSEESARRGLDGVDRSVVIGLPLAFSATRSLEEVGPRRNPLKRRAELLEDLALWAGER